MSTHDFESQPTSSSESAESTVSCALIGIREIESTKTVDPTPRMDEYRSGVSLNRDSCSSSQQHRRCQDENV
jgi:hypothetical protein